MKMTLLDEEKAKTDKRFEIDVFSGIDNPRNPNGNGYPVDIQALMTKALYRLPVPPGAKSNAKFVADLGAAALVAEQFDPKVATNFRGIPIEVLGN
jgi:hypothetical protein